MVTVGGPKHRSRMIPTLPQPIQSIWRGKVLLYAKYNGKQGIRYSHYCARVKGKPQKFGFDAVHIPLAFLRAAPAARSLFPTVTTDLCVPTALERSWRILMSQWTDRIQNHGVWQQMKDLGAAIDNGAAREGASVAAIEGLERLRAVLTFAGRRLAGGNPQLPSNNTPDALPDPPHEPT